MNLRAVLAVLLFVFYGPLGAQAPSQPPPAALTAATAGILEMMAQVRLLREASVEQELRMSAEQIQQIAQLRVSFPPAEVTDRAARQAEMEKNTVEVKKQLRVLLTPEQAARLQQIHWQQRRPAGLAAVVALADVQAELKLSQQQSEQVRAAQETLTSRRRESRGQGASYAERQRELIAAHDQEIEKLLTAEQNAKLKELLGPPFTGQIRQPFTAWTGAGPGGLPNRDTSGRDRRPFEVGSSTRTPWNYFSYPDVQKDLKLTDEQRQKLPNLGRTFGIRGEDVQKVLTAEQVARLWQLQLQIGQQRSGPFYIFGYRDVAEALGFTEEQKKSLAAAESGGVGVGNGRTREQAQQQLAEILTDEQEAKLKTLLGLPFTGEIPRSLSSSTAGTGEGSCAQAEFQIASTSQTPGGWMRYAAVREDLKLSEDQVQKVNAILQRERTIAPEALAELLSPEQLARLQELQRQLVQRQSGPAYLFRYREVADPLALSDEQKHKIEQLARSYNQFRPSEPVQQIRSRIDEILTAEQQAEFDKLLGKPFAGDLGRGNPLSPPTRPGERQRPSN